MDKGPTKKITKEEALNAIRALKSGYNTRYPGTIQIDEFLKNKARGENLLIKFVEDHFKQREIAATVLREKSLRETGLTILPADANDIKEDMQ